MCYFVIVVSFLMAWVEAWFLDFKVLPREQKARERGENTTLQQVAKRKCPKETLFSPD